MSTFNGVMAEFPDIRVDFFRRVAGYGNPLAGFLSHVHSDHLEGLDSIKAPFVYCSAATKELLLRLERRPHRINFQLGILESRHQTYRHLKKLLKPIPLEAPTRIELSLGNEIQVTLFDANHCMGAVMFLFESTNNAVLYTGDIRSEPWFVNSLARNPILIEYTSGMKQLDCVYLDTSFTAPISFPTKSDGLTELVRKVKEYPADTIFHFAAWTFGYEEVWLALSRALDSQVHVDTYKFKLYESLVTRSTETPLFQAMNNFAAPSAAALAGFVVGNTRCSGVLTTDPNARLHSCEKGMGCAAMENKNVVWIKPIITRTASGREIGEIGVGGGGGDLNQQMELELDPADTSELLNRFQQSNPEYVQELVQALKTGRGTIFGLDMLQDWQVLGGFDIVATIQAIITLLKRKKVVQTDASKEYGKNLQRFITFPFSRHSSYEELCHLLSIFKVNDIWPCTVDRTSWNEEVAVEKLFGQYCSTKIFRHDENMRHLQDSRELAAGVERESHTPSPSPLLDVGSDGYGSVMMVAQNEACYNFEHSAAVIGVEPLEQVSEVGIEVVQSMPLFKSDPVRQSIQLQQSSNIAKEMSHDEDINLTDVSSSQQCGKLGRALSETSAESPQRRKRQRLESSDSEIVGNLEIDLDLHPGDDCDPELQVAVVDVDALPNIPEATYWDSQDDILRCSACGWEFDRLIGHCFNLTRQCNNQTLPDRKVMEIDVSDLDEFKTENLDRVFLEVLEEEYTDYLEEYAADSEDEAQNEYDAEDSFIDDSTLSVGSTKTDDHDGDAELEESMYRTKYEALLIVSHELQNDLDLLNASFRRYRHENDDFSSAEESEDYGSDECSIDYPLSYAEIDVKIKDPPLSEVVLAQLQGDSQASILTPDRVNDRTAAYSAALEVDQGWNISIISVDDNHSKPDIVL